MCGRIKWNKKEPGCIIVALRYVDAKRAHQESYVRPGQEILGVPYEKWEANINRVVKLWEWHGTGAGMIGGPAKQEVAWMMWGGAAEFPEHHKKARLVEAVDEIQADLDSDRYDLAPAVIASARQKIRELRFYAEHPRWNRMDFLQRIGLQREFWKDDIPEKVQE